MHSQPITQLWSHIVGCCAITNKRTYSILKTVVYVDHSLSALCGQAVKSLRRKKIREEVFMWVRWDVKRKMFADGKDFQEQFKLPQCLKKRVKAGFTTRE